MSVLSLNTPNQGQKGHHKNLTVLPASHESLPICNQTLSLHFSLVQRMDAR